MKKGVKIFLIIFLSIIILVGIIVPLLPYMLRLQPAYGAPSFEFPIAEPMIGVNLVYFIMVSI